MTDKRFPDQRYANPDLMCPNHSKPVSKKLYIKFVYINILLKKITIPPGTLPKMYTKKKNFASPETMYKSLKTELKILNTISIHLGYFQKLKFKIHFAGPEIKIARSGLTKPLLLGYTG